MSLVYLKTITGGSINVFLSVSAYIQREKHKQVENKNLKLSFILIFWSLLGNAGLFPRLYFFWSRLLHRRIIFLQGPSEKKVSLCLTLLTLLITNRIFPQRGWLMKKAAK